MKGQFNMQEQVVQIASRIKDLREISGVSVESLAKKLGIDMELYKKYENGEKDIPIGLLYELSGYFDVELTAILTGDEPKLNSYSLVRKGKGMRVERTKYYDYHSLAYKFINKKAEPFLVTVEPDGEESIHLNSHPGQEFNYVLEGSLNLIIDNHLLTLNEGDSLFFDSSLMHGMKALNGKKAVFLAIII